MSKKTPFSVTHNSREHSGYLEDSGAVCIYNDRGIPIQVNSNRPTALVPEAKKLVKLWLKTGAW